MKLRAAFLAGSIAASAAVAAEFDAASATNHVGIDLFRAVAREHAGNLVLSPYSIESALVLAHAGAAGATRAEMARALRLSEDDAAVQRGFAGLRSALDAAAAKGNQLSQRLNDSGPKAYAVMNGKRTELAAESVPAIEWRVANRLFAQVGYPFHNEFLERLRGPYDAPLQPLDFRTQSPRARNVINEWVSEQTREKIRDLIPANGISSDTRLVLVNALYLKAAWMTPFVREGTRLEPFHISMGETREVPTMRRGGTLPYAHEAALTIVALDYVGRDLQCLLLLPDSGRSLDDVVDRLSAEDLARWAKLADKPGARVVLHLPKFRVEGATLSLGRELRGLGMRSAFDEPRRSANFERMAPRRPDDYLFLSEVYHQTFVALDEEGTEAAAATAVVMALGAAMERTPPIEVRFDRPFLFAIQHRVTGVCLFLGRITAPR
jgi:serpin B